ncbi:MAG: hypothetical protein AAFO81_03880 [Pseudomonadota bacterium]
MSARLRPVAISVPGKLLLSGEYAVLDGAPAIVSCVDRFCDAQAVPAAQHSVTVTGPEAFSDAFELVNGEVHWASGADSPARQMLATLLRALPPVGPMALTIDSTAFYSGKRKLGLGSSAAVAVAAGTVLAGASGYADAMQTIADAHAVFQGGQGSGADIYTVARGGTVLYKRPPTVPAIYSSVSWPAGLIALPIACPVAASTKDRIRRFARWREQHTDSGHAVAALGAAATAVASVWRRGDAPAVLAALRAFTQQMQSVAEAANLEYMLGGHEALTELARAYDIVYKPCGAGGGDFGVALAVDSQALADFSTAASDAGFDVPTMSVVGNAPILRSVSAGDF